MRRFGNASRWSREAALAAEVQGDCCSVSAKGTERKRCERRSHGSGVLRPPSSFGMIAAAVSATSSSVGAAPRQPISAGPAAWPHWAALAASNVAGSAARPLPLAMLAPWPDSTVGDLARAPASSRDPRTRRTPPPSSATMSWSLEALASPESGELPRSASSHNRTSSGNSVVSRSRSCSGMPCEAWRPSMQPAPPRRGADDSARRRPLGTRQSAEVTAVEAKSFAGAELPAPLPVLTGESFTGHHSEPSFAAAELLPAARIPANGASAETSSEAASV
mmetsp:Transcript_54972/g.159130  ORF Transcript_54972/g.159130 Transcript_54972/m.159130 type:complete len:278 (-) Transcript_54972:286-1119(-)